MPDNILEASLVSLEEAERLDKWAALHEKAQSRAFVRLELAHEDPVKGGRIYNVRYRRFCYKDYKHARCQIYESPHSLSFSYQTQSNGRMSESWRYVCSFRSGRLRLFKVSPPRDAADVGKKVIRSGFPERFDLMAAIKEPYPAAKKRFARRFIKMLRAKARTNGATLPKGDFDDLTEFLIQALWPAAKSVREQFKAIRGTELNIDHNLRWILRRLRGAPDSIVKSMTGYDSRVVTRLFWEAIKCQPRDSKRPYVPNLNEDNWESKWSWLALLRTYLPVDYTQQILKSEKIAEWCIRFSEDPSALRRFLKQWDAKKVTRMLTDTCADGFTIRDTMQMLDQWPNQHNGEQLTRRFKDIPEMHEWLSAERNRAVVERQAAWVRRMQNLQNQMTPEQRAEEEAREAAWKKKQEEPLSRMEWAKEIDGDMVMTPDGKVYMIVAPKTGLDLVAWGESMRNCIGSYRAQIETGYSRILGVIEGSEIKWGIEIDPKTRRVIQFRGVCNKEAPLEVRNAVESELVKHRLIDFAYHQKVTLEPGAYAAIAALDPAETIF
jgi:hypothetical protein